MRGRAYRRRPAVSRTAQGQDRFRVDATGATCYGPFRASGLVCRPALAAVQEGRQGRGSVVAASLDSCDADTAIDVTRMNKSSPTPPLLAGMLAIWSILAPATAHAWVVVIKNHTNELMTFCYTITEMGSGCFGSTDVPPNGTATVNMGRACAGKWRVTRARDGQVQAFSRPGGAACGDGQLIIRPNGLGFSLGGS